ncbi:MAG: pre-16S rRNA-processing nuclease YqgF, partial [Chloroflexi bacterium]|nr:pre-16S rRNA-processing nuclease YqgF [Chloroflexota bacterium]
AQIASTWQAFAHDHPALTTVVGDGTGSGPVVEALRSAGADPHLIAEPFTTQQARARYFAAYPPRGWRRLVPRGLLTPPVPVDDFAALILAENWIAQRQAAASGN